MDILSTLFHQQSRRLGPDTNLIVPSVVISERHSDTLEITEHPVEVGAAISDHAYRRPYEVVMQVGFAGGGSLLDLLDTTSFGVSAGLSPKDVYQNLLDLQNSRVPFDVVTGKRIYTNMLIRAIEVTTDRTSENVLSAVLTLREVIITSSTTKQVAAKADMKLGANTSAVQDSGVKTSKPVANESALKSSGVFDGLKGTRLGNIIGIQ
ncbi:TPA: phage baseplate protein [Klebsiella pneumoniae]